MKRMTRWLVTGPIAAAIVGASAPASAVSLATSGPAHPAPQRDLLPVTLPVAETLTAGSGALVPLVAMEGTAADIVTIDASALTGGGDVGKPVDDISFLALATETGRKDMNAARDALVQLTDPELKRVAEALIQVHVDANTRMARIADAKKWPMPPSQGLTAPPAGTTSADFDAHWTDDMIFSHERAVALYSAQAQGGEDPELRAYARDTLPTLQHHLAELRRLQK